MLGLLALTIMSGMCVADSVKKANITYNNKEEARQLNSPVYYNAKGVRIHRKTGLPCIVQFCKYNRGRIYRDYKLRILEIEGEVSPEEIAHPFAC